MRTPWPILLTLALVAVAGPAFAAAPNPYNVSWAALDPGTDWAAQVIRSIFPIPGGTPGTSTGSEATVIQLIVGQFTGFVAVIACFFVTYTVLVSIHRAAETGRILGTNQSWIFVLRLGFAGIMMFPLGGGFSAGQAMVMQGAMVGVGMAKALYTNAIQAVGPDAVVIAQPMIPGTRKIVAGLIDSELCMDLVNLASNTATGGNPLIPIPNPVTATDNANGGYLSYRYSLTAGNEAGNPVCGTVTIRKSQGTPATVAGTNVDMAAVQQSVLNNVLTGSIRNQVASAAQNLWQNRQASALTPLQAVFTNADAAYTAELTSAATAVWNSLNSAVTANASQYRNGTNDLLAGEQQQNALGWTAAGAYYLEIAKLNATTLSLLNATPVTTSPTYEGLGPAISYDLAPFEAMQSQFMATLNALVQTSDGTSEPSGIPYTLADARTGNDGQGTLTRLFNDVGLSEPGFLHFVTNNLLPSSQYWTDPFGGLMALGQALINTALIAAGTTVALSSKIGAIGLAAVNALHGDLAAAAASLAGNVIITAAATLIYAAIFSIFLPGIVIAYVLPMIPYVMWMAGVAGWIILVCEAMVAVPLWMLAHMTLGGDGLHGRATEGWSLLFSVVFRPTLMVIGLFLGYFVFDCMSWLIRQTFGVAAGFVLTNGWLVSNFVGMAVLLSIFVMTHLVAALTSFRMIALLPHHLPRLIGFTSGNRVDMDDFQNRAAWGIGGIVADRTATGIGKAVSGAAEGMKSLPSGPAGYISGPEGAAAAAEGGMDSTLRAASDTSGEGEGEDA